VFATVPLSEVCVQERVSVRAGERPELRYVGLESIEPHTGLLAQGDLSKTPNAPEANAFVFSESHVLYGKLRPYLNKVYVPVFSGKCSTELIPLRPNNRIHREYLAYFLRAPATAEKIAQRVAGARMPRAEMPFVMSLAIPLPSLDEQRRITDLLSRAENIVRMRREAEQKAKEIIPALFLDMFGDPATNPKGWRTTTLSEVVADGPQNGLYKHADTYGSGTPILRIDGFYDGRVRPLAEWKRLRLDAAEAKRFRLTEGDIVVNRVNSPEYLGKSAIIPRLEEPAVYESNMMRVSVSRETALPEFVIAYLQTAFARSALIKNAKHAINQSSINQDDVRSVLIYLPPISDQAAFRSRAAEGRSLEDQQGRATEQAKDTFRSLLAGVFGDKTIFGAANA
jgi:type I restriction enzyme, S subunit